MLATSIVFFALAILMGITLLTFVMQGKKPPRPLVFIHGPLAAAGIIILTAYILSSVYGPTASLYVFIAAALGGFFLAYRDFTGKTIPKGVALIHGMIAVTGFILLLAFILK